MAALRFVTDGHADAYTAVDGERLAMENFDLLLTPRFTWHDHHNPSDKDVYWLDGLDIGLLLSLNAVFYEPYGEDSQKLRTGDSDAIGTRTHWLRPTWEQTRTDQLPLRYPWAQVRETLQRYDDQAGNPYDGLALHYANPVTGGPTMSTIDCWVQRFAPGFAGRSHRRTSSSISYVISGEGVLELDDRTLDFGPGDVLAIPNWTSFAWRNRSRTDHVQLFSMHDTPVLQAFGLLYEEPEPILGATPSPAVPSTPLTPLYLDNAFRGVAR